MAEYGLFKSYIYTCKQIEVPQSVMYILRWHCDEEYAILSYLFAEEKQDEHTYSLCIFWIISCLTRNLQMVTLFAIYMPKWSYLTTAYPMLTRKSWRAIFEKSVLFENSQWIKKTQNNIVCKYIYPDLYGTNCEHIDEITGFTLITIKYLSTQ